MELCPGEVKKSVGSARADPGVRFLSRALPKKKLAPGGTSTGDEEVAATGGGAFRGFCLPPRWTAAAGVLTGKALRLLSSCRCGVTIELIGLIARANAAARCAVVHIDWV